jgi:methionine synthase II (cobalamin-independent)
MFTVTKDKALLTTTTGALPRPSWYTANLRGLPLSQGFSQQAYREQHFDTLACHVASQHRAGIDIFVDGDTRLDDDVAGRSWVSYATERIEGIGAPRVEVPPAGFMADKGPGDLMWEVIADPNQRIKPQQWVDAFNAEIKGLHDKCEVWCHTCWGSPAAQRVASSNQSYKAALPYFDQLDIDVFTVEGAFNNGMDLEHFGTMISKSKKIALGVISHRTLQVERPDEVADLIRRALKHIAPERLILTSDCGFGRQSMSRMHAYYKMVALVRGTNIVRKELGLPEAYIPGADPKISMVPMGR